MRFVIVLSLFHLVGCARLVTTKVTSKTDSGFVFEKPIKLYWKEPSRELIESENIAICKKYFGENKNVENSSEQCEDCIIVEMEAQKYGSHSYSEQGKVFNWQKSQYEDAAVTETEHERIIDLKFFSKDKLIHQVKGISWGATRDISKVLPQMCSSVAEDFPNNLSRKVYEKRFD